MTTQVSFKVDNMIKKHAMSRAKKEGISLTSIIAIFLQNYANGKINIGLQLTNNEYPNTIEDQRAYKEAIHDYNNRETIDFEDFRKELHAGHTK